MHYFMAENGDVYAYDDDQIAMGYPLVPMRPMTSEEIEVYLHPLPTPAEVLAAQSQKLQGLVQLANAQKVALAARIGTLSDAIELEMATPAEEAELILRTAQLKQWKTYAVLLGRVTAQVGWPPEVVWPVQPSAGMDLSVSATTPQVS